MWTTFIGFMGSGKSTVARCVQAATRRAVVSLDDAVAAAAGRSVAEIFAAEGEAGFRRRELAALEQLAARRNLVLDAGGGVVETPAATALLRGAGAVIWLDAPWETVRGRLEGAPAGGRPLVDALGWDGLRELYVRRRRLYASAADFRLSNTGDPDLTARTATLRSLLWSRRREPGAR